MTETDCRCSSGWCAAARETEPGSTTPSPMPVISLTVLRAVSDCMGSTRAVAIEPAANTTVPAISIRRRPSRTASLPEAR